MEIGLRPARQADISDIEVLIREAYRDAFARIPDMPDVSDGIAEAISEDQVIVGETDGVLMGVIIYSISETSAHLINVATHPDARGTGLGRRLIDHAERDAQGQGARRMALATHVDMPENVRLYERLGWQVTERSDNKVVMEKALGPK